MPSKYPDSGTLNHQTQKANQNSPDFWGYANLSIGLIKQLLAEAEQNGEGRLKMSGWNKQGPKGPFISVSLQDAATAASGGMRGGSGGGGSQRPPNPTQTRPVRGKPVDDIDDEIPF